MARPNILFITADQQRADCIGIEGETSKHPSDDLCREGTRFLQPLPLVWSASLPALLF